MTKFVIATLACCLAFVAVSAADRPTFDGVDVDAILKDPETVKIYVDCILGKGACNDSAKRLKDIVPNALLEKCSKCTDAQKRIVGFIAYTMSTKSPQQWESVLDKYDPKKEKRAEIAELIKNAAATKTAAGSTAQPSGTTTASTAKPKSG